MRIDPTAVIVALIGFAGIALGVYFSRKGQRRSEVQAEKATEVDRITKTYDTQQKLIEDLRSERDRIYELHTTERERAAATLEGCHRHIETLTRALADLGSVVDANIARSAALVSEEDPNSPDAEQRVKDFIQTMRRIGESE